MDPQAASAHTISIMNKSPLEQLSQAKTILKIGIDNVNIARSTAVSTDGRFVANVNWARELYPEIFSSEASAKAAAEGDALPKHEKPEDLELSDCNAVWNMISDLQIELLFIYHRISIKIKELGKKTKFDSLILIFHTAE